MKNLKTFEQHSNKEEKEIPNKIQREYNELILRNMDGSADPDIVEIENRIEEIRKKYPNIKRKYK